MKSDVSFPRNPFITITRSQVLRLLLELKNLAYNYVHHTVWQSQPEQTGTMQSKPSDPNYPHPYLQNKGISGLLELCLT